MRSQLVERDDDRGDGVKEWARSHLLGRPAPLTLFLSVAACTHWSVEQSYSPRQEVARRLVGTPIVEEVTPTTVTDRGGSAVSVKRTHCVQQAQIDYTQEIGLRATTSGRGADLGISIPVIALGLFVIGEPMKAYGPGAAMLIGGGAWLITSLAVLPGSRPTMAPKARRWTETTYVESQGCGSAQDIPEPQPKPLPQPSPTEP
jgi:hypothetical protein